MKHTGYTPGPWTVDGDAIGTDDYLVCRLGEDNDGNIVDADAALIADAPNLAARVERLEAALRKIEAEECPTCGAQDQDDCPVTIARAALAGEE